MVGSARNAHAAALRPVDPDADKGFTLIELVVVIVILSALSGTLALSMKGVSGGAKTAACRADVASVNAAGNAYLTLSADGLPARSLDALVAAGFLLSKPQDVEYTPLGAAFTAVGPACP